MMCLSRYSHARLDAGMNGVGLCMVRDADAETNPKIVAGVF